MLLNIPFYQNNKEGNQCAQVAMQSVIKHFLNKEFSLDELDKLTGRKPNLWTWTSQIASVLCNLGLNIKYYSKTDLIPFLEGESFFRKNYGEEANHMLKFTDLPVLINAIKNLKTHNIFEKKISNLNEIENHLNQGHIPIVLVDGNKLANKKGNYMGHFITITGFDKQNIFYHESGPLNPEQNKKVSKQVFIDAWNSNCTDNDIIIVLGKFN